MIVLDCVKNIATQGNHKKITKDVQKEKARLRSEAVKQLDEHLLSGTCKEFQEVQHPLLTNIICQPVDSPQDRKHGIDSKISEWQVSYVDSILPKVMIKRPLPKSIRERKNIIKVGDNAAMLANENNNWTFWLLKVHALTLNTITCHWYDLHDGKFFLQYIDGDSKKPSLSVYNHNEITLIHWGFEPPSSS